MVAEEKPKVEDIGAILLMERGTHSLASSCPYRCSEAETKASTTRIKAVHPFPARMAPSIVWDKLPDKPSLRILDPMAGSGTTLTIARSKGHIAYGIDRDPLAVTIARTWCADIDEDLLRTKASEVLGRARTTFEKLKSKDAYPAGADKETKAFVRFWFDLKNRRELAALSKHLSLVRSGSLRNSLWTAFSRMIITKRIGVSLAMDISHSRPHRVYDTAPVTAFQSFLGSVEKVIKAIPFRSSDNRSPVAQISHGDSRKLDFEDDFFDMAVTSPPYLNAIDYLRGHKLSLVWMKNSIAKIRNLRSTNIGAEVRENLPSQQHLAKALHIAGNVDDLPTRQKGFIIRYIVDMDKVCSEIARVLKPGGKVIYVIGDCTTKGVFIRNSDAIRYLSEQHGLKLLEREERLLPENRRYLPPPTNANAGSQLQSRIRQEIILTMQKT